jgi:16S rRNA (cytidine1402-2'-O)-methyltransferase
MNAIGKLVLVPTPISESGSLEPVAFEMLNKAATTHIDNSIFAIEDLKPGRKRWLEFGLPRSVVEHFVLYNEHTAEKISHELLDKLKQGYTVYLMSDGGLPAFYDPGIELVRLCHQNNIKVTSTPFCNSIALAVALSGFNHKKFWFEGFLPLDKDERKNVLEKCFGNQHMSIIMDTPYRLKRLLEEIAEVSKDGRNKKKLFLAMDLNSTSEELLIGHALELIARIKDFKREFILLISE